MRKLAVAVIVLILGFLAYIATSNLRIALDRSHQKRTMADMRSIGTAIEAAGTDLVFFPAPHADDFATMRTVSFGELERTLQPKYIRKLPRMDAWKNTLEVRVGRIDLERRMQRFAVRSVGKDGDAEGEHYVLGTISNFAQDIVYSDGNFIRYPEGV